MAASPEKARRVTFTDRYGVTVRWDYFDDTDGRRLGSGTRETRQALTFAPTLALGQGLGVLLEIRREWSDQAVFEADSLRPTSSWLGIALEMTYNS